MRMASAEDSQVWGLCNHTEGCAACWRCPEALWGLNGSEADGKPRVYETPAMGLRPVSAQCLPEGKQQCELTLGGLEAPRHLWQRQAKRCIAKFGRQQRVSPSGPLYFQRLLVRERSQEWVYGVTSWEHKHTDKVETPREREATAAGLTVITSTRN